MKSITKLAGAVCLQFLARNLLYTSAHARRTAPMDRAAGRRVCVNIHS